jgi:hypothetical protein
MKSGEYYDFEVIDVALVESQKKKTPGIDFTLKVTDGEESQAMHNELWLSDSVIQSGNNQGKTVTEANLEQLQENFGLPDAMDTESLRSFYIGKTGRVKLEAEEYNGKTKLRVKGMYSTSAKSTTIDPMVLAKLNNVLGQFKPVTAPKAPKKSFFPPKGK